MSATVATELAEVEALRRRMWANGYRPVEVASVDNPGASPGKRPVANAWQDGARRNPPEAATRPATADAMNTGTLCDGIRAVDIDIDDAGIAAAVEMAASFVLGFAPPTRFRANSGRLLLLFRAAESEPRKRTLKGAAGTVEVLGHGQQFVAFGLHPSGATLEWRNGSPETVAATDLPAVTEDQISAFFAEIAGIVGADKATVAATNVAAETTTSGKEKTDAELAPPNAAAVIELLNMPNPLEADRTVYEQVNLATVGCIHSGMALGRITEEEADEIRVAASDWSTRWEGGGSDLEDEFRKFGRDWDKRTRKLSGWPHLVMLAGSLGVEVSGHLHDIAAAEFAMSPLPAEALGEAAAVAQRKPRLLSIDDIEALPDPVWLVEGLVQESTLAIVMGPPKHGKTFVALSMALHIAAGRDFFGAAVRQGGVVYIAGEGAGGLKLRIRAARGHYGMAASIPFWTLPVAVNFSDDRAVDDLIKSVREETQGAPISLVVVDTLARAMPGVDENSAGEVGRVIAACDRVKEQLGCAVMPIHHQGKDREKGMRGSSALDGAVDTLLRVTRDRSVPGSDVVTLATIYQKDAEEGAPILFDLTVVQAAQGRSSLVPTLRTSSAPAAEKLTAQQKAALLVLTDMLCECGDGFVAEDAWRQRCVDGRSVSASEIEKSRREAFKTAFEALVRRGRITAEDGMVKLATA